MSWLFKKIFGWFRSHKWVSYLFGGIGVGTAGYGLYEGYKGKKINKKALEIYTQAKEDYELSYDDVTKKLEKLGKLKDGVSAGFTSFSNLIELIQERPSFMKAFSDIKISEIELHEIKVLSEKIEMIAAGAGGAAVGGIVGLAAFGANAFALGPAAGVGGIALCIKGNQIMKKAVSTKKEAKDLRKEVDKVLVFYQELKGASELLYRDMSDLYDLFTRDLSRGWNIVKQNTSWKSYSKEEKTIINNLVMETKLLVEMVKLDIIIKPDNEEKIETINRKGLTELKREIEKVKRTAA